MIPASPSVSRLIRRDLGSCSHFPCRAELFGWLATSLAEGLLAGATSEQVPQTNKTQKLLNQVLWIIRKIGLVCWKRDRLTCVLGLHLSFFGLCKSERWLWVSANTLIINVFVFVSAQVMKPQEAELVTEISKVRWTFPHQPAWICETY